MFLKSRNKIIKRIKPGCDVYLNEKTGNFIIENFCIDKNYFTTSYGSLSTLSREEMENNGIRVILNSMKDFYKRVKVEKSELETLSPHQQNKFSLKHKLVGITLTEPLKLVLIPMHRNRGGGHEGHIDSSEEVILPCSNHEFMKKLNLAFGKC